MYGSILVPLDGTAFGERALPAAVAVARRTGAALTLAHVHAGGGDGALARERGYLEAVRERVVAAAEVPVRVVLGDGPVAKTLADAAKGADLVVLATHAHGGVSRLWHHGVAAYLSRHLSVPLLMVRDEGPVDELADGPEFGHVLLPLGGSAYSEHVLDHALELGRTFGAHFTLLEVVPPPIQLGYTFEAQAGHVNQDELDARRRQAQAYLEGIAEGLRSRGVSAAAAVEVSASPADGIVRYATREGAGLIALETHGLGGVAHALSEGVVAEVLRHSPVPVLVHHDTPAADREREDAYASAIGRGMGWSRAAAPHAGQP
ncbi:MAG TPA: universal stress protein [Longimicrobium sp.]|nr:universal stress protein [Longimicrobium sp.]